MNLLLTQVLMPGQSPVFCHTVVLQLFPHPIQNSIYIAIWANLTVEIGSDVINEFWFKWQVLARDHFQDVACVKLNERTIC